MDACTTQQYLVKGLSFNSKKTQVVDFTLKKVKATKKVQINGAPIEYSKRATYLGMILDEKLSFGPHINNKINKCKQHLYALQRVIGQKYGPNPHLMRWAYTGIVRPKLTYGCHLWSHKLTKTLKEKIKRLDRLCCLIFDTNLTRKRFHSKYNQMIKFD